MFQINTNCVGCHNCYSECPMQAIEWLGNKYEIDQEKCVRCGLCAKVCHTASIINTEEDLTIPAHERVYRKADVVVCGTGTGLAGAVKAAMEGKKVIVLEKSRKLGGNTDYAHGYFPIYSKWHQAAGMPDVREEAVAYYRKATNNVIEEDVLRTAIYGTSAFFDWLCEISDAERYYRLVPTGTTDVHGPVYGPGLIEFPTRQFDNLNCRDDAIGPGWGGTFVKYAMLNAIEKYGLDIEIYTETAGRHLLLDDAGRIRGILAEDPGGEVQIDAPVVILATGGFGRSDEKLKKYKPWFFEGRPIHRFSVPTDTGDAIDMLQELGVEPNEDRMFVSMFAAKHHPFSNVLADLALDARMLQLTSEGKRWVNEEGNLFAMTAAINDVPGQLSWAVQSRSNVKQIADEIIGDPAFASKANLYATWEDELMEEAGLPVPPCLIGTTLDDLAQKMGADANTLKETVQRYNTFCENGLDADFGKSGHMLLPVSDEGPYYAILGQRFSEAAMGGLMVDGECRVLRNDGTYIPGLYGVGDATSAMHRKNELAVISELTWGFASSYTSGCNAVNYINKGGC